MLQNEIIYLLLPPQKGKNAHFKPRFFWLAFFQDAINQKIASPSKSRRWELQRLRRRNKKAAGIPCRFSFIFVAKIQKMDKFKVEL